MDDGDAHLEAWLAALDELTYYELFGVDPVATVDDIRDAFHVFCATFHPDQHMGRSEETRRGLGTIFKRATEAYAVLTDPLLREEYDAQLQLQLESAKPSRPPRLSASPLSRPPSRRAPASLEDAVRAPSARPFARRADELLKSGDLRQAKLQLVMANHMDPQNPVLEAALGDVSAKVAAPK